MWRFIHTLQADEYGPSGGRCLPVTERVHLACYGSLIWECKRFGPMSSRYTGLSHSIVIVNKLNGVIFCIENLKKKVVNVSGSTHKPHISFVIVAHMFTASNTLTVDSVRWINRLHVPTCSLFIYASSVSPAVDVKLIFHKQYSCIHVLYLLALHYLFHRHPMLNSSFMLLDF